MTISNRKNQHRIYPWDQPIDPNCRALMCYINSLPHANRKNDRDRLEFIINYFYANFGLKSLDCYTPDQISQFLLSIRDNVDFRTQKKDGYLNCLKRVFDFMKINYDSNLFNIILDGPCIWDQPGDPNRDLIIEYLNSLNCESTISRDRRKLNEDFKFLYMNCAIKPLLEYDSKDFKALFQFIQKKQIQQSSKERFRTALKNLISSVTDLMRAENQPIPRDYQYIFSQKFFSFIESSAKTIDRHWLNAEQLKAFYVELKQRNSHHYIMFRVFLSSVRVGGLANILIKNINFIHNYFETRDKPTRGSSGWNRYFFPADLAPELRMYILQRGLNSEQRLFPYNPNYINKILKKYRNWGCHDFRRSILKLWRKAGMDLIDRNILSNHHMPADAEIDSIYTGDTGIEYLQSIYEKFYKIIFN